MQFGNLKLPSNIFYSPLAGCSNYPFRQMAARYRPGLFFCEMVKMEALIRQKVDTLLDFDKDMHPIGAQLCGTNPQIAKVTAKMIEDLGFDVVDLNCGCPVDKVTKDGSGSGMLKNPDLIGEVLANMVAAVQIPVTVKIRLGWDETSIIAPQIVQIAESAGAKAISIHGRTRKQGYRGVADWEAIREAKQAAKTIKVIGNGDVTDGESALNLLKQTKCDGILVGRGTLGKPWIVSEIAAALEGSPYTPPSPLQVKNELLDHIELIRHYLDEKTAVLEVRKISCWYLREVPGVKALRMAINRLKSIDEMVKIIATDFN